jgi:hypothetical protein
MLIAKQLALFDQSLEGLNHKLFPRLDIAEDVLLENEIASVDFHVGLTHAFDFLDVVVLAHGDDVITQGRSNANTAGDLPMRMKLFDWAGKCKSVKPSL